MRKERAANLTPLMRRGGGGGGGLYVSRLNFKPLYLPISERPHVAVGISNVSNSECFSNINAFS